MPKDPLEEYRRKRDSKKTPEPAGRRAKSGSQRKARFVIQQHDATAMHWDFRLEAEGVLKSWAVPKGPSTDPREKRLAMPTEDHPIEYRTFEGVIPDGEYGAGPVIVWDAGTYRNLTDKKGQEIPVEEGVRNGHVKVFLEGQKLQGAYALTRTGQGDRPRWILVKMKDEYADARRNPVRSEPQSVITGKTLKDLGLRKRGTRRPRSGS